MRRVGQRGGDESGVDFYREGPGMKEEEMGQHKEGEGRGLACWLCGDGTIRYFDALQMATTFHREKATASRSTSHFFPDDDDDDDTCSFPGN